MKNNPFQSAKPVLIFNTKQVLVAITNSLHTSADLTFGNVQSISFACTGRYVHSAGLYFRHLSDQILLEIDDIGSLRLPEYDRMCCDNDRKYYTCKQMREIRQISLNRKVEKGGQHD